MDRHVGGILTDWLKQLRAKQTNEHGRANCDALIAQLNSKEANRGR